MIVCRAAGLADAQGIDTLARAAGLAVTSERQLGLPHAHVWVAELSGSLVGFLVAWRLSDEFELVDLATRADQRRRGVASRLLDTLKATASELGASGIHLEVRASNSAALACYGKQGFRVVSKRRNYYAGPREDAICMHLPLDTSPAGAA